MPVGKAIRPTAELHIEAVHNSLVSIVRAAPVGNDYAIKTPFAFQNIVQQILVMAGMLALYRL